MNRLSLIAVILLGSTASTAWAQQAPAGVTQRVDRLEREMRAVQRKVFPGSAGQQIFDPEIAPPAPETGGGVPASTPLADLTGRVSTLEQELQRMTNQVEQQGFKLRQLEEQLSKMKGDTDFRLNALEGGAPVSSGPSSPNPPIAAAPASTPSVSPPAPKPAADPAAQASAPSGDAGEDAYMAGYRLWEAKRYPEAITALRAVVAKYPKHRRASYAQNLIGRAYLDDGKPAAAAEAFYTNYQTMPRGERAPDSLVYLGQALIQLKKPAEACKVYDELQDVYGAKLSAPLRDRVTKSRVDANCGA